MWKPRLLTPIFILRDVVAFNASFFCHCCLHPDDNSGREEPTEEKDRSGNESQGEDEDIGLAENDRDEEKSDGEDKDEGEDKGRCISDSQSPYPCSAAVQWRQNEHWNGAIMAFSAFLLFWIVSFILCCLPKRLHTCTTVEWALFTVASARWDAVSWGLPGCSVSTHTHTHTHIHTYVHMPDLTARAVNRRNTCDHVFKDTWWKCGVWDITFLCRLSPSRSRATRSLKDGGRQRLRSIHCRDERLDLVCLWFRFTWLRVGLCNSIISPSLLCIESACSVFLLSAVHQAGSSPQSILAFNASARCIIWRRSWTLCRASGAETYHPELRQMRTEAHANGSEGKAFFLISRLDSRR